MQYWRKFFLALLIISLVFLLACNGVTGPEPDVPDSAEDDPSDNPIPVPVYTPEDFLDYPGNYYPEQEPTVSFHENIDDLFTQYFSCMIALDPELVTSRRFSEDVAARQDDKLTPVSFGYKAWRLELAKDTLEVLAQYSDADLTPEQRVNKAILEWALELTVAEEEFFYHDILLLQELVSLSVFMQITHAVEDTEDAENYLARLEQIPWVLEQIRVNLEIQEEAGCVPPKVVLEGANFFPYLEQDFATKVAGLTEGEALAERCRQIMDDSVAPALRLLEDQIDGMKSKAVNNVSEMPNGKKYYEFLLHSYLTADTPPEEVHQMCVEEVDSLQEEILRVMADLGYAGTNYIAVIDEISAEVIPQEEILDTYREIVVEAEESILPQLFGRLPQTRVDVQFSKVRAGYELPTRDDTLPGIFLAHERGSHPKYGAKWYTWHETVPGHHIQFAIEHEADIPYFRDFLFLSGYLEGWGTYGEMLPFEFELVDDPKSYLISLDRYLMLAARVVMDTGVNYMGWSEQEAREYFREVTGLDAKPYLEDVMSRPGRSAAYYAGMLKFRELRERAKNELGAAFDLREFHDLVLQYGSMPLDVLEDLVEEYIQDNRG